MTRNIFIFLGTFVAGALIALVARAAMFAPHKGHEGHPAPGGDYAGMVSNPLVPANTGAQQAEVWGASEVSRSTRAGSPSLKTGMVPSVRKCSHGRP